MKKLIALVLSFMPSLAFAQAVNNIPQQVGNKITDINGVVSTATRIGNVVVALAISFAVIWIIVSVVRFFIAGDGEEAKQKGKDAIIYGVIGLFLILSIWGLVFILTNTFKTENQVPNNINGGSSGIVPSNIPQI